MNELATPEEELGYFLEIQADDAVKGVLVGFCCAVSWERIRNSEWGKSREEDAVKGRQCRGGCPPYGCTL
ncbi:GL21093 [Drosophila persimilis]|uniref:GL21093 n=1 Tax=Drosophila persimilis TaxID=7234 RepID=B4GWZ2_DROPE|nr:GL21093 [Drosophila persimilis]